MADERLPDILRVFEAALERAGAERAAYLDAECGADAALRHEVEALLAEPSEEQLPPLELSLRASPAVAVGQRLGPYVIVAPIGAGGMGEVYKARDTRLERTVAIKVLTALAALDPDRRRRFEYEARAIAALNHSHICTLHDVGREVPSSPDGRREAEGAGREGGKSSTRAPVDFLVMEYLEGESLAERLHKGPLAIEQALGVGAQIAGALAAAHRQGVVHRDLKPANIMLVKSGAGPQVKLLDFGLAKLRSPRVATPGVAADPSSGSAMTSPGAVLGTVPYMAPEQVAGRETDARTDIFAFGAVLYEMLTGLRAFPGTTEASVFAAILTFDPPAVSRMRPLTPPALDRLIQRCLAKDPEVRWQSSADLADELRWMHETGAASASDRMVTSPPRRSRLQTAGRWGAVVLVAAGVVLGALALRRTAPPPPLATFEPKTFDRLPITNARFMPDGQRIVFSAATHGMQPDLYMVSPNVEAPQTLGVSNAQLLSVSAKGEVALILNARWIAHRLYSGTLARMTIGSSPRPVMQGVREADWAQDGNSLAIIKDLGNGRDRLEYPVGTTLYETTGYLSDPRVSPDGTRVAIFEHKWRFDDRGIIKVIDCNRHAVTLSTEFWELEGLAWTPDGSALLFSASASGGLALQPMLVPASGRGAPRPVLGVPGRVVVSDLRPDGRWLVVREDFSFGVRARVPSQSTERDLSWLGSSGARAISTDGEWLLMVDVGRGGGKQYGVVLRRTDGSVTLRLGDGNAQRISSDGKWVSAIVTTPPQLLLYPTGTGERIRIAASAIENYVSAEWFPDGKRLLVCASETSHAPRCSEQPLDGSAAKPLTPEGVLASLAPDGRTLLLTMPDGTAQVSSITGEFHRPVAGFRAGDRQIAWSRDSQSIFVQNGYDVPALVERVDTVSGHRAVVGKVAPEGLSTIAIVDLVDWVDDGRWYVYNYTSLPCTLFVVSGGVR